MGIQQRLFLCKLHIPREKAGKGAGREAEYQRIIVIVYFVERKRAQNIERELRLGRVGRELIAGLQALYGFATCLCGFVHHVTAVFLVGGDMRRIDGVGRKKPEQAGKAANVIAMDMCDKYGFELLYAAGPKRLDKPWERFGAPGIDEVMQPACGNKYTITITDVDEQYLQVFGGGGLGMLCAAGYGKYGKQTQYACENFLQ
jgi:hypothetical protein